MDKPLPFLNWSLKKAMNTEPDSFTRARIGIIYTLLLFALLKAVVVIGIGAVHEQWLQVMRAGVAFVLYNLLLKIVLYRPGRLPILAHFMLIAGVLIIWTNIFVYAHKVNLVTVQFVFMAVVSSFYILGSRSGFIYSILGIIPIAVFQLLESSGSVHFAEATQEFASPGFEIIVVLNFVSIIIAHYLFYNAFRANNEQLQKSIAEATKLAETKSMFLSTMSHELRTPLNSVVGMTELLLDDQPEEGQKENLKILHSSSLDLLSLINNILDFNKIDSDKLELEAVPFALAGFMQNICAALKVKAVDKQLGFNLAIDKALENTQVVSDPTRLSQLIYNLVSNAIKFTDNGCVTVKLEVANKTEHDVEVLFSVSDTGIGIDASRHEAIFELFTQAESHTTRKYGGTGLGLAIVKQVLALFNSSIQLESEPGKGTRFFFTLLLKTTNEAHAKAPVQASSADMSHLRILVAEDNDVNRSLMQKQLGKVNITPTIVENGAQAYEACLQGGYDAIFMDLHMPELNGYDATRQIRAIPDAAKARVYIIAFTASVSDQHRMADTGFDDFLYKPVRMNDLRDKLQQIAEMTA